LHYILFFDDYTRWTTVYLLPDKKQETCIAAYQHYQAKVDARGYNIKRFRCDNGRGEYDNRLFRMLLATRGTALEFCPPYAHHKNGVAEGMICTITEKARAMILDSQAPLEFWGKRSTLQYTSINVCQTKGSPKETIATDIKLLTKLHTKCCTLMLNPNSTPKARKSVTKHHSIICAVLDATSVDSSPRNRGQTRSLELDQKHA